MITRSPSDQEIELLKRALSRQCESRCIVPEGVEALLVAQQLMELFSLGITDEQELATAMLCPSPRGGLISAFHGSAVSAAPKG